MQSRTTARWILAALILGLVAGGGVVLATGPHGKAKPQVVEGYVTAVNQNGAAIGLSQELGGPGEGYIIAGALWRKPGTGWSDRFPTCLEPLTSGQRVRLGVVEVDTFSDGGGRSMVASLECLNSIRPE